MSKCQSFGEIVSDYRGSGNFPFPPNTYGYTFVNKGDTAVIVMDHNLKPYPPGRPDLSGESYSYVDAQGRTFQKVKFQVTFDTTPAADPWLQVTVYFYADENS